LEINWHITADDKACVKAILEEQRNKELVLDRYKRNLADTKPRVTKDAFWRAMVCMRLTLFAPDGPEESRNAKFRAQPGFPLAYEVMCKERGIEILIRETIRTYEIGGLFNKMAHDLAEAFKRLENREWSTALDQCNRLVRLEPRETEIEVADYINTFEGFGPWQARGILQELGLTRYEIPINSRVTKWLNEELKFPFTVTPIASLYDKHYYKLILDGVCKLCAECETYPCVLAAAIFSAQDEVSKLNI